MSETPLNNETFHPLYLQLADQLREDIRTGKYKKGEKIPTEEQLSEAYQVSRVTVRNALKILTRDNLLSRKQRKGTFVTEDKLQRNIVLNTSFSNICRENGKVPGSKVLKCMLERANASDVSELLIPENSPVIVLERIRYADDVPVSIETSRFPERFSFLLDEDFNNASLFDILKDKYDIVFYRNPYVKKTIELVFASYETAYYLNLPDGYPLISVSALSCDSDNHPIHRSLQLIVGDKFKLYV